MASLSLVFDLLIGRDTASPALDRIGGAAGRAGGAIGSAIGNVAANGISSGLSALKDFAGGAVDAFAAVEDATGAAGVQFGDALPKVVAFADAASKGFGISKREALEAQNTFGTFGKAAGMTEGDLAGFSQKLTGLAGDLASFKGTSVEQAIGAIGSALKGEADPIEAFGVQMNAAAIQSEALAQGLIKNTKDALTPQQKTLAVSALLFKQTKDAQGDYARTSEGTANTQKTLAAEMENAQVALGQKLAPAMTVVRKVMLGLVKGASGLMDAIAPIAGAVTQVVESLLTGDFKGGVLSEDSPIIAGVFRVREAFQSVKEYVDVFWLALTGGSEVGEFDGALRMVNDTAIRLREVFDGFVGFLRDNLQPILAVVTGALGGALVPALIGLAGLLAGPVIAAVGAFVGVLASPVVLIGALVGALIYAYKNFEGFRDVVDKVVAFVMDKAVPAFLDLADKVQEYVGKAIAYVRDNWDEIREVIAKVLTVIKAVITTWVSVVQEMWQRFGDNIKDAVEVAFDLIKNNIEAVLTVIQGVIKTLTALIKGDWEGVWEGMRQVVEGVWTAIKGLVEAGLRLAKEAVEIGLDALALLWGLAWDAIVAVVSAAWDAIKNGVSAAWDAIKNALSSAVSSVKDAFVGMIAAYVTAISNVWTAIKDGVSGAWDAVQRALGTAVDAVVGFFKTRVDNFKTNIGLAWTAIKDAIPAAWRAIGEAVRDAIGTLVDKAKAFGGDIVDALVDGIKISASKVTDVVKGVLDKVPGLSFVAGAVGDGPGKGGKTLSRVQSMLPKGAYVTSTYRSPAENAAVGGSPTSYHLDRANPAVDIGGPKAVLDSLYRQMSAAGGWRELLWQVPGHYDHIHAADKGGVFQGPGLVYMGAGQETFASGLAAKKIADLPQSNDRTDDLIAEIRALRDDVRQSEDRRLMHARTGAYGG